MPVDFIRTEGGLRFEEPEHIERVPGVNDATFQRRYYVAVIPDRSLGVAVACEEPDRECRANWDMDAAVDLCYRPAPPREKLGACLDDVQQRAHWWRCAAGEQPNAADFGFVKATPPTGRSVPAEFQRDYRPRARRKAAWHVSRPTETRR